MQFRVLFLDKVSKVSLENIGGIRQQVCQAQQTNPISSATTA